MRVSSHGAFCTPRTLTPTDAYGRVGRPPRNQPGDHRHCEQDNRHEIYDLGRFDGDVGDPKPSKTASSTRGTGSVIGKYR